MKSLRVAVLMFGSLAAFSLLLSQQVPVRAPITPRSPEVKTDQSDYAPGSTAYIIGTGFLPKETVSLQVLHADGTPDTGADHEAWFVQTTAHGDLVAAWHVCEDDCVGALLELTAVGQRSGLTARTQFTDGPSANEALEGWFDLALQWGGTIQGSNSRYSEGDTIPLRFKASLPSGTTHTVLLKYDFSSGGNQRFFDSLASYNASVQSVDPTIGITGLASPLQWPIPLDASLPTPAQIPAALRLLTTYNISALNYVGSYTLTNGVKAIRVNFTVTSGTAQKNVLIAYGGHLASEPAWGLGNGASHFPGASTKAFASLDANADKNLSVNPSAIVGSVDLTPPVITCPPSIDRSTDPGRCSAIVTYTATATDNNPGVTVMCDPPSGSEFPIGNTLVTCTARDAAGNVSTCTFKVTIQDSPNVSWPQALPLPLVQNAGFLHATFDQCVTAPDQSRWFKFKVHPGSRLIVTLTGLPANYDLVLFKDIATTFAELTSLTSQQDLVHLSAEFASDAFSPAAFSADAFSPAAFSPAAFSPAAFSPAAFSPAAFSPAAFSPAAFSPADFSPDAFAPAAFSPAAFSPAAFSPDKFSVYAFSPAAFSPAAFSAAQIQSVLAVSAFDGTAGEGIIANTWDEEGDFYVRVRGRNGVFSSAGPFHLQVFVLSGNCDNVKSVPPLPPSTFKAPSGNYKTIILTDLNRMIGLEPSPAKAELQSKLATFAAQDEVNGVVVDVGNDNDPWVSFFNAQATTNVDCPFAKNLVAGAIQDIVDRSRAGNALEYVVIVGGDAVIPFFRYPDEALLGPEKHYFPPVRDLTPSQASLRLNYVLGQDQYGAACTVSSKFTTLPVPGLAVGRLVETPSEVTAMLDAYLDLELSGGVVPTPTSALVTGYDFLEDVANAVRTNLVAGLRAGATTDALILSRTNPPTSPLAWTADVLRGQLLGKRHDLIFLAGHFSAIAALAADYSTHILSTELADSTVDLKNAILFSPGCHSGYNTVDADGIPFVTLQPDWAQACARKQMTLLAGTGYQYGDTDFIEYSERIYLEFIRQLRVGTGAIPIGKALVRAKEIYLATTPQMRGIHQKAFLEATLFGLPMLSVDMPGARLQSNADQSVVASTQPFTNIPGDPGATLGLRFADLLVTPSLTSHQLVLTNPEDGSTATATYFSGVDGIINNPAEPILPLEIRNVSVPNTVLRGVGFLGGDYTDVANILPLTGAPTTEIRGVHAAFLPDFFYPIKPWLVNYFDALCNGVNGPTRLLVLPAQFVSDIPNSARGTLREYQSMDFRLFYSTNTATYTSNNIPSTPALSAPPSISGVSGITVGGNVRLSAHVTGNPAAGIQLVWVTYTAQSGPFAGHWQSLDLAQTALDSDSTLWEGSLSLNGTAPEDVRYMVQAVNGVGAVALDTKLGAYHVPDETEGTGAPTTIALLTAPTSGAYGTVVTFKAQLTSNGSPLGSKKLRFSLGDQELQGVTATDGVVTNKLNLLTVPGSYELKVTFGGAAGYAPTFTTSPFTITKQTTALSLSPPTAYARPNADTHIVATLVDGANTPILESTVFFVVTGTGGSNAVANITDFIGRAPLGSVRLTNGSPLPDGSYTVTVYFATNSVPLPFPPPNSSVDLSDERYEPSSAAATLIIDSQKPVMSTPTATPSVLRPPNHKMISVTVSVTAVDNNGPVSCKIVSVTSNEPINGTGDGDQEPDWNITGDLTVDLRAERAQNGTGRTYTITVECEDLAGNVATKPVTVFVPK